MVAETEAVRSSAWFSLFDTERDREERRMERMGRQSRGTPRLELKWEEHGTISHESKARREMLLCLVTS